MWDKQIEAAEITGNKLIINPSQSPYWNSNFIYSGVR